MDTREGDPEEILNFSRDYDEGIHGVWGRERSACIVYSDPGYESLKEGS